jgi:hypothetical protein
MRYGLFRMAPLWIYQQRRSGLGGKTLPGFESLPPLGTRCRWVRLPAMCYRCRCRRRRPFAGVASSGRQVVVAATMWVVDAVWGLRSFVVRGGLGAGGGSDQRRTGYDKCRSPFSRRTGRAYHLLSPPLCFCHSNSTVPAHIPLERGGAGAAVVIPDS